ncbi:MAG: hypothetical protein HY351_04590 [Candidatus Omnitrophica bacterium]|nr:hypothetical protein [Candidatus Omnitrophota bacterium]
MKKKPIGVLLLTIIGVLAAIFIISVGLMFFSLFYLLAGISVLILSLYIFFLKNWARITAIILSIVKLLIDVSLLMAARYVDPFFGMGLVFSSPLTLISIICLVYLTRPRIKALFHQNA